MTRSASFDGFRAGLDHLVGECPSSRTRCARLGDASVTTTVFAAPDACAARAIDEPIRPTPISARRSKMGAVMRSR